ncbi:GNAT family N-acetyltransferase [Roseomonas elaeocarpi]|uniref:GNAT family N-acetyltransferase n=1 Tax=Roseomonas elaeocarpi TaxID=907779 RepID=A0ABV6JPA7_9PROT
MSGVTIREAEADVDTLRALAGILRACVEAGASVGFLLPFPEAAAEAFWQNLRPAFQTGHRRLLVAEDARNGAILGTVQLVLDTPANGRHRAEIAKLLVHPQARRRGIARALMRAAEAMARREGRTLLVLDTRTGDAAEPLYRALGFQVTGVVPRYARGTHGALEDCTFLHKLLD